MTRYYTWLLTLVLGVVLHIGAHAQTVSLGKQATLRAQTTNAQTYEWTFPDGVVINGEVVQYTFTDPGPQQVRLRVTDFEGNTNEITRTILVANDSRPTAVIELRVNGQVVSGDNVEVSLEDGITLSSASFAVDKQASDFNNNWTVNGRSYPEVSLSTVFNRIGTYSVQLEVTDPLNNNQKDQTSIQLKVVNQPPVITNIEVTPLSSSNEQVRVRAVASDPDGQISTYRFEALEAGKPVLTQLVETDNTVFDLSRFPGRHTYNFRVTVSDDLFLSTTQTDNTKVEVDPVANNNPPQVQLQVVPGNQAYVGEPFNFQAVATDADNDSLRYDWKVSDGARYSARSFQRVFLEPGTYTVDLTVSDGLESVTESLDVTIATREVTAATNNAPVINITGVLPAESGTMNDLFKFYLEASDADGDQLTYNWDFGNGALSSTKNAAYIYSQPGDYTVKVSVSDGIETVTDQVTISVAIGARKAYFETADQCLADLEAERAALEAEIAANGGEVTDAQRARLATLNDELRVLIRNASANGDSSSLDQLAAINRSLTDIAGQIRASDQSDFESFVVELTEEQQANLDASQEAARLARDRSQARLTAQGATRTDARSAAQTEQQAQRDRQDAERARLEAERRQLEADLAAAVAARNTVAEAQLRAQLQERTDGITAIDQAQATQKARQLAERTALEAERADLVEALKLAVANQDAAAQQRLTDQLNERDAAIREMRTMASDQADRQQDERDALAADRDRLLTLRQQAVTQNDAAEQARIDALLAERNAAIDQIEADLAAQETRQAAERTALQAERDQLLQLQRDAEARNDQVEADRLAALVTERTNAIDQITADLEAQATRQARDQATIEAERNQLLRDVATLEGQRNTEARQRMQVLVNLRNEEIRGSEQMQADQAQRQADQRNDIQAERDALAADMAVARQNRDTAAQARIQALIDSRDQALADFDAARVDQADRQADELAALEAERALLQAEQATLDSTRDAAAIAQIQTQIDRRDIAIDEARDRLLDQEADFAEQTRLMLEDWEALKLASDEARAAGDADRLASLEALKQKRIDAIAKSAEEARDYQTVLAEQQASLKAQRDTLKAEMDAAVAASDAQSAARLQVQLDLRDAAITANAEAVASHQETVSLQQQALREQHASLLTQRDEAQARRDTGAQSRLDEQLSLMNAAITASAQAAADQQATLTSLQSALATRREEMRAEMQTARESADAQKAQQLAAQIAEQDRVIAATQAAMVQFQADLSEQQSTLEVERQRLKADSQAALAARDAAAQARIEAQLLEINTVISTSNSAALAHRKALKAEKARLDEEREALSEASREALRAADMAEAQRLMAQVQQMDQARNRLNQAISENEAQASEYRAQIEAEREELLVAMQAARAAGDQAQAEALSSQLAQIELVRASFDRLPSKDVASAQQAEFEAKKAANSLLLAEIEAARAAGLSLDELADSIDAKTALMNVNSDEFKSAATTLEQLERIERAKFLDSQIDNLETLVENPTPLPTLGVSRQNPESLPERLNRIESQADKVEREAKEREAVAAEIANVKQQAKLDQLTALEAALETESDEARKTLIQTRITTVKTEIRELEKIKDPSTIVTADEVEARVVELVNDRDKLTQTVTTEQRDFIEEQIKQVQSQIDLTFEADEKERLEIKKKRLEANLGKEDILADYESDLKSRQRELNQLLATDLSTSAEQLAESQLSAIESKLNNFNKLTETQESINTLDLDGEEAASVQIDSFLISEKAALELEQRQLKADIARSMDSIDKRAKEQRLAVVEEQLAAMPEEVGSQRGIEDLKVTQVVSYLEHFKAVKTANKESKTEIDRVQAQIDLLNRLNTYGYTPQTQLSTLMVDLQRREGELLEEYRVATGEKAEGLKTRLLVLSEAMEQLAGLSDYDIAMSDSVFRANQKLDQAVENASLLFISARTEVERALITETLETLRVSQRWLGRFYKEDARNMTLGELEASLKAALDNESTEQDVADIAEIQSIKANLNKAIAAQFQTDFDNFKANLAKQAKSVNDPGEKAALEARIKALEADAFTEEMTLDQADAFESLMADMTIKVNTNLFLYADIPLTEYPQPLLFKWELGDGETRFGQNVNHEFFEPGFYRVVLTMFDGVTSDQDLFTIKVVE